MAMSMTRCCALLVFVAIRPAWSLTPNPMPSLTGADRLNESLQSGGDAERTNARLFSSYDNAAEYAPSGGVVSAQPPKAKPGQRAPSLTATRTVPEPGPTTGNGGGRSAGKTAMLGFGLAAGIAAFAFSGGLSGIAGILMGGGIKGILAWGLIGAIVGLFLGKGHKK